jgi:hypothetical protein
VSRGEDAAPRPIPAAESAPFKPNFRVFSVCTFSLKRRSGGTKDAIGIRRECRRSRNALTALDTDMRVPRPKHIEHIQAYVGVSRWASGAL